MENELKNSSRNFRSEKFVWSEFLAEWKTALKETQDLIPEINKIVFGYLWKGSAAKPIAQETLFLHRDRGGLGILVPLIQGQALKIKYLLQLGKKDNTNIWTCLGRYWVSSKIHDFTPHWQFLRSNVIPKITIPTYRIAIQMYYP